MMTDRELLEFAAKAAGIEINDYREYDPKLEGKTRQYWGVYVEYEEWSGDYWLWNPLVSDGDALRLAVNLGFQLNLRHHTNEIYVYGAPTGRVDQSAVLDPYAATRRAIVQAAAEIGRAM